MAVLDWASRAAQWLAGGDRPYHTLLHCMNNDMPWVITTVTLDVIVAAGYVLIAYHWRKNERLLTPSPARRALANMRSIFTFCGICGYVFVPVKMVWPAWRLYDGFMLVLVFYTWTYALNAKRLKVVYSAVGRSESLAEDLSKMREESARKTFFLNAISHDLRTPLNGLMLQTSLAEMHTQDGDTAAVAEVLSKIRMSARHTADLLDGLMEFARLGTEADRVVSLPFDLDDVVTESVAAHVNAAVPKTVEILTAGETGLTLNGDRLKVARILNNLVSNAVQFTPSGSVTVEVTQIQGAVQIAVIDTGIGIDPKHHGRLFDEFYQVHNDERDRDKGLGLGLTISRRLANQLGGEILVDSSVGVGSRFTLVLPTPGLAARRAVPTASAQLLGAGAFAR